MFKSNGVDEVIESSSSSAHPVKKTLVDRQQLSAHIKKCDQVLADLDRYIKHRIELTEEVCGHEILYVAMRTMANCNHVRTVQAGLMVPRIVRLCRKYRFSQHEENIFLLMTVMQVCLDAECLKQYWVFLISLFH